MANPPDSGPSSVFAGGGDVGRLCRELDWARTSLGPVEQWPAALRSIVRTTLASPFPTSLWCGSDSVLIYNDAYRAVLGSKHPYALGKPGWEVWAEIWPQIGPMFEQILAGGPSVFAEDAPFVVERDPGTDAAAAKEPNAWFTFSLSPVRAEDGTVVAFLNIVSETTGRVQAERAREAALAAAERAEARLREVFSQAPAFMAVLQGDDLVFEYANDAYYTLVGHRELIGRRAFDALEEVRGQRFEELLHSVMTSGKPYVGREVPLMIRHTRDAPPEERFVDFVYYPVRQVDGTSSGVVAHGYDITEHVHLREEARRARAEAEQANHAKSQFLANMSHEIRTPINAVVGYSDLLDADIGGPLSEKQREYVDRIRASSRHLLGLVNDVLDLSKIEAGEMVVRSRTLHSRDVLASAVQMVAPEAEARGLTLKEEWSCDDDRHFAGDEGRVRQILLNLLSNAMKFTTAGGTITTRCELRMTPSPAAALPDWGPWVVFEVQDTGTGIAPDQQERVFDAFVQAEGGHTRRAGGTGLGLTISRRLARLMGGDITLQSEVGAGSCFTLWLPATSQSTVSQTRRAGDSPVDWPAPEDVDAFVAVGQLLIESADSIEDELVWRLHSLRSRGSEIRDLDDSERAHLADHSAAAISAIGRTVTALADPVANHDMIQDGTELRRVLSRRHGRQRRRIGFTSDELSREYGILREIVEAIVQRDIRHRTDQDFTRALDAVHGVIDENRTDSLRAWDEAAS